MTLLWTTPRVWVTKDPITKEKLNDISNNLTYLFQPSIGAATIRGTGSDVGITSTTPVAVDDALLGVSVELSGRPVRIKWQQCLINNTLNAYTIFDVLYDTTNYISSLTSTQLTNGMAKYRTAVASTEYILNFDLIIPAGTFSAGVHTFAPRAWVSSGTATFRMSSGWFTHFSVGEF